MNKQPNFLIVLDWKFDSFTRKRSLAWFVRNGADGRDIESFSSFDGAASWLRARGYEHTTDIQSDIHGEITVWTKKEVSA